MNRRTLLIGLAAATSGLGCFLGQPRKGDNRVVVQATTALQAERAVDILERRIRALNPWYGTVKRNGTLITIEVSPIVEVSALLQTGRLGFHWESKGETGRQLAEPDALWIEEPPFLHHQHVESATLAYDSTGDPYIATQLVKAMAADFGKTTAENVGRRLVIVVDQTMLAAPIVREAIPGGFVSIGMAGVTQNEAERFTMLVAAGPLPVLVHISTETID